MGTRVITWCADDYPRPRISDDSDWFMGWLGHRVSFKLGGHTFTGEVIETDREFLCNGIHDILTVEVEDEPKQVKVQLHRQACTRLD